MAKTLHPESSNAIKVFFSYAREDEPLRDELVKQLSLLKRAGHIEEWHDRLIVPGADWAKAIDENLNAAHLILLLVSADFIASEYCYGVELKRALERNEAGEASVIPVLLRAVDWAAAPFSKLQALPTDARPVTSWPNRDEAFADIARGIRAAVEALRPNVDLPRAPARGGGLKVSYPGWLRLVSAGRPAMPLAGEQRAPDDELKEREYLSTLSAYLKSRNQEWEQQSDPGVTIIPTPAHPRKPMDRPAKSAQPAPGGRASLFKYNPADYLKNLNLKHVELSTRALFGRRTKIKDLAKELKKHKKIVVLGEPGSGKSVCLRQLAYDLCQEGLARKGRPRTLPIYIEMTTYKDWEDEAAGVPTSPLTFLQNSLADPSIYTSLADDPEHPMLYMSARLPQVLRSGRATLIFDALDEMPQESYQQRYKALRRFTEKWELYPRNRFIFSCRLLDYDPSFAVSEIIIDPFDKKKMRLFLEENAPGMAKALGQKIEDDKVLAELVSNPFFLRAWTYINRWQEEVNKQRREEGDKTVIPVSRGGLIARFVEALLVREVERKQKEILSGIDGGLPTLRAFLSEIGFALQEGRGGRTSASTESFGDIWDRYPQWKEMLWIAQRADILRERGVTPDVIAVEEPDKIKLPQLIEFKHHRLQEYFAAEGLAKRLTAGEAVDRYLEDIWWQETVVFAIGVVKDPSPIIERMLSPQADTDKWIEDVRERALDDAAKGLS